MKGIELKEIRNKIGKNQTELAEMLGVAMRTVQNWEKDVNKIPETVSQVLLTKIGKSTDTVYYKEDEYTTLIIDKLFQSDAFKERLKFYINENIISHEVTEQVLKYYAGLMEIAKKEDKKSNV